MLRALDDGELLRLLREDAPYGDLTSSALGLASAHGELSFSARRAMRVCGVEEAARLFELSGAQARLLCASGQDCAAGAPMLLAHGPAQSLLLAWKVAQTLCEYASGIASEVARMIALLREAGHAQPLACTRKNFPGTRALAAQAVRAGGGVMHRLGLSESLLIFPEHRLFLADPVAAVAALRQAQPEKRLVVEVEDEHSALTLAAAGVDVLQLERFSPTAARACRAALRARDLHPLLAVAGGVTIGNALDYAAAGVDLLVSSAPYHAPPADVKVAFARLD